MCGEKAGLVFQLACPLGSPPRVRGKVSRQRTALDAHGITPAYAGKRRPPAQSTRGARGHPRVCGEKCGYRLPFRSIVGSPPTVRGKVAGNLEQGRVVGITPACAGKRWRGFARCQNVRDHPRVCGEKSFNRYTPAYRSGSPPRVRGKVRPHGGRLGRRGITPACAGKSIPSSRP